MTSVLASGVVDGALYPNLYALLKLQYERTPSHKAYLEKRFDGANREHFVALEELAGQIAALAGERLPEVCDGYDFICKIVREEEVYFRRHGRYRLDTFQEANRLVYSDKPYMAKYMDGLLLTQIYWSNHSACFAFYRKQFLGNAPDHYDYLEIGPGHGLLLYQALSDDRCASVMAWDLSQASIDATREAIVALGAKREARLLLQDLYDAKGYEKQFDCVTFSEVLEHLEDPHGALLSLYEILKPGGRLYVNVPINSPAPDHLYLLKSPEESLAAVTKAGFEIERSAFFPMTNHTMEQAVKHRLTISACIIGKRPI
jgi:2-polyprenyl-3-methyl-5-hydroxy-6-metoxy-1,4-benzoquinol methylase